MPAAQLPVLRWARFDPDASDPTAELERLVRLRERWRGLRDRLHRLPLAEGTVADYAATLKHVFDTQPIDVAVLAMAVSDFEPEPYTGKVSSDAETLVVQCRRTPKVIRSVRDWAPAIYLVGFKLLSGASREELIRRAENAGRINRADLTVANDLQLLRQGRHTLHLVRPGAEPETLEPGDDLADRLVTRIITWSAARRSGLSPPHLPG
jgi:phosphopantothenate-cysteine ligase